VSGKRLRPTHFPVLVGGFCGVSGGGVRVDWVDFFGLEGGELSTDSEISSEAVVFCISAEKPASHTAPKQIKTPFSHKNITPRLINKNPQVFGSSAQLVTQRFRKLTPPLSLSRSIDSLW